jgi:hypothetical protein
MSNIQKDQDPSEDVNGTNQLRAAYSAPTLEVQQLQMIVLGSLGGESDSGSELPN